MKQLALLFSFYSAGVMRGVYCFLQAIHQRLYI